MSLRTRGGKPVVDTFGLPQVTVGADSPVSPDLGQTVYLDTDANGKQFPVLSVTSSIPEEYAYFAIIWYGTVASEPTADTWFFSAQSGPIGGNECLGVFKDEPPTKYQLMAVDSYGNPSYMTFPATVLSSPPASGTFTYTSGPVLQSPIVEGQPLIWSDLVWSGDSGVDYDILMYLSQDNTGTGEEEAPYTGYAPSIVGLLGSVCVAALFKGPGTEGLEGPYRSNRVTITAATDTSTPPALGPTEARPVASYIRYGTKWRAPLVRFTEGVVLANNPLHFTSGQTSVTVNIPDHGFSVGSKFRLGRATAAAGLTISGELTVATVPDKDHVTITAATSASSTTAGGGSNVIFYYSNPSATLGSDPFQFFSGQNEVTVSWPNHKAAIGKYFECTGAIAGPNVTVNGVFPIISVVDSNYFKIQVTTFANANTVGGGTVAVGSIRNHNQPFLLANNPLATNSGSATVTLAVPNHKLQVGREIKVVGLVDTGGITAANLNGDRTVSAIPDADHISFVAGAGATTTVATGGGSGAAVLPRWNEMRWSRSTPDPLTNLISDNLSEETPLGWQEYVAGSGIWTMFMEDALKEGNPSSQSPRTCYSVYDAEAFQKFRFAYKEVSTWSWWSDAFDVPAIVVTPPTGVLKWLQFSDRKKEDYDDNDPSSYGVQFERVITCYKGTNPARLGWVLYGQDENGVWISKDGGKTFGSKTIYGLYCSQMSGLYLDDDCAIYVGNAFSTAAWNGAKPYAGIYVGDPDLNYAYRLNLTRTGLGPSAGSGLVQAFVKPMHGGSDRNWQNCVARRPQTGSLTRAQRPVWVVENQMEDPNPGSNIVAMYVWKMILSDVAEVASMTMVRTLPLTWADGDKGISTIEVAPNGDIVLCGPKGVYLSTDQMATQPTSIFSRACRSAKFTDGGASTVSGIIIADNSSTGGVYSSSNVRTTTVTKPNGNSGLPSGYKAKQMGYDGNQTIAVCDGTEKPYVSRNRGQTWTTVSEPRRSGDEAWRYNIRSSSGPASFTHVDGMPGNWTIATFQTFVQSDDNLLTVDAKGATFFDGHHIKGIGYSQTASEWDRFLKVAQDDCQNLGISSKYTRATGIASTGNDTLKAQVASYGGGSKNYLTGFSGLVADNYRIISGLTRDTGSTICVSCIIEGRNTDGTYNALTLYNSGKTSKMYRSDWSRKEDSVGFLGRWCVSNANAATPAGVVWTDRTREYIDHNMDGSTLVSFWGNHGVNSGSQIYRSTDDRGASQSLWHTPTSGYVPKSACIDHHHSTLERMFYVPINAPTTIREAKKVGGSIQDTLVVDIQTMVGGVNDVIQAKIGTDAYIAPFKLTQILSFPDIAGRWVAIGGRHGHPNWWLSEDDGDTWENISKGTPATIYYGFVYPPTSEVIAGCSLGGRVLPVPTGSTGLAHENGLYNDLHDFYNNPLVPNPPDFT